ncbi:MAG: UvrD-helicase domain-containing protein [Acidobacteria bacterium]|nr:UvrD-helicase domain-containing protein [Acidobacteriota bacterium]
MSGDLLDQLGRGHGVISASAGTGKTFTLLQIVLREAELGTKLDQILAVTFTRKGAMELRERIRHGLAAAMREAKTEEAARRFREARRELERATLTTIHGFCQQALQERAFEAGKLLDAKLSPGPDLASRAFQIALRKGLAGPDRARWEQALEDPGPERLKRWLLDLVPAVDLAEPSLNDLRDLVSKFDGAMVESLQSAAGALKAQSRRPLEELIGQIESALPASGDVHAFAARAASWKRPTDKEAIWWQAIPEDTRSLISDLRAFPLFALDLIPLAKAVAFEFAALKASEGLLDYGDIIHQLRLALEGAGGEVLADQLAGRYSLCLLDEAQDTNEDQWAILWKLFNRDDKRLVLVGDAKQAIFGFQGGDLPAFGAARADLLKHDGRSVPLTRNWRATPDLIEACNAILGLGQGGAFLREPGDEVSGFIDEDLLAAEPCPDPPQWMGSMPAVVALPVPYCNDVESAARASASALADQLLALRAAAPRFRTREAPEGKPFSWRDAFLLVRTSKEAGRLASVLREKGIPFVQHKPRGLFEDDAAEDLLALLLAMEDPSDGARRMRAFLTPFFGLTLEDAERARELSEDHPLLARLRAWSRALSLDRILDESGVVARLLAEEAGQRRVADLLHLVELLQRAAGPGDGPADHARRLAAWAADEGLPEGEEEATRRIEQAGDAVRILTLHAAKGLEAPVVALYGALGLGADPNRLPLHRYHLHLGNRWERRAWLGAARPKRIEAHVHAEEWAELRRLLYVGLTRAQGLLLLPVHEAPSEEKKGKTFDEDGVPRGPYGLVQRRLMELRSDSPGWLHWGALHLGASASAEAKPSLLIPPPFPFEKIRARAWPPRMESFTSLQRRMEAEGVSDPEPDRAPKAEGLPGGTETGIVLHAMLERMDTSDCAPTFRGWWNEARQAWAEARCREAGLDPGWAMDAARLAYAGFSHPLPLPGVTPVALRALEPGRLLRELDFLVQGDHGRLTGALDALFEHEGRTFLLDWKSNRLAGYGPEELDACMAEDYALQVKVYTGAVLKALGISDEAAYETRFGGIAYVFLRGLPEGGVWTARPTWPETQAWRAEVDAMLEAGHA